MAVLLVFPARLFAQENPTAAQPGGNEPPPATESPSPKKAQPSSELEFQKQERDRLNEEIAVIEAKAKRTEAVKETMDAFRNVVTEEMIRSAPDLETKIRRQNELVEEITADVVAVPKKEDESKDKDSAKEEKLVELRELRYELEPVESRVQELESVQLARETYYTTLVVEMQNIDPRKQSLIEKHRQITREIAEMEQNS
jgi:hypothetical protein